MPGVLIVRKSLVFWSPTNSHLIRAYNIRTGSVVQTFSGARAEILCGDVLGWWLWTGAQDLSVRVYNVKSGRLQHAYQTKGGVTALAFDQQRGHVFAGSFDRSVYVFDMVGERQQVKRLVGHTGRIRSLLFSKKLDRLFSADDDTSVRCWNVETFEQVQVFDMSYPVLTMTIWDEHTIIITPKDFQCHLLDMESGEKLHSIKQRNDINAVAVHQEDSTFYTAGRDGTAIKWKWTARDQPPEKVFTLIHGPERSGRVTYVGVHDGGKTIVTAGYRGLLKVWDRESGELLRSMGRDSRMFNIESTHYDGARDLAFIGDTGRTCLAFRLSTSAMLEYYEEPQVQINTLMDWPDNRITCNDGMKLLVVDKQTGERVHKYDGLHTRRVNAVRQLSSTKLITCSNDRTALMFSTTTGKVIRTFVVSWNTTHRGPVYDCALFKLADLPESPGRTKAEKQIASLPVKEKTDEEDGQGHLLLTVGGDERANLFHVGTGSPISQFHVPDTTNVWSVVLLRDRVFFASDAAKVFEYHLWDNEKPVRVMGGKHTLPIVKLCVSPNRLWTASDDSFVIGWDIAETSPTLGQSVVTCEGHSLDVWTVVYDERFGIFSSGADHKVICWDPETGARKFTFDGHTTSVEGVMIDKQGMLFSGSDTLWAHNVPLALSLGVVQRQNLSASSTNVVRTLQNYGSMAEFVLMIGILIVDFFQLVAFAFTSPIPWNVDEEILAFLQYFQLLLFEIKYIWALGVSLALILLFVVAFLLSERLEAMKLLRTHAYHQYLWVVLSLAMKVISRPMFLPIFSVLVVSFNCDIYSDLTGDACYDNTHYVTMGAAFLGILLYVPLCFRFLRVLGNLDNIEAEGSLVSYLLNWSGDKVAVTFDHPLSFRKTGSQYFVLTYLAKMLLTLLTVFLADPLLVSIVLVVIGLAIVPINYYYPPFFSSRANELRSALDIGTAWTFCCSLVAVLSQRADGPPHLGIILLPAAIIPLMIAGWYFYGTGRFLVTGKQREQDPMRVGADYLLQNVLPAGAVPLAQAAPQRKYKPLITASESGRKKLAKKKPTDHLPRAGQTLESEKARRERIGDTSPITASPFAVAVAQRAQQMLNLPEDAVPLGTEARASMLNPEATRLDTIVDAPENEAGARAESVLRTDAGASSGSRKQRRSSRSSLRDAAPTEPSGDGAAAPPDAGADDAGSKDDVKKPSSSAGPSASPPGKPSSLSEPPADDEA